MCCRKVALNRTIFGTLDVMFLGKNGTEEI